MQIKCTYCNNLMTSEEADKQLMEQNTILHDSVKRLKAANEDMAKALKHGENSRSTTVLNLIRQLLELTKDE
jgi:hypothetical protein